MQNILLLHSETAQSQAIQYLLFSEHVPVKSILETRFCSTVRDGFPSNSVALYSMAYDPCRLPRLEPTCPMTSPPRESLLRSTSAPLLLTGRFLLVRRRKQRSVLWLSGARLMGRGRRCPPPPSPPPPYGAASKRGRGEGGGREQSLACQEHCQGCCNVHVSSMAHAHNDVITLRGVPCGVMVCHGHRMQSVHLYLY